MPFSIVRNDITKMEVDAIVNSTSPIPSTGGGTEAKINQVAGEKLFMERSSLGNLYTTQAVMTEGFNLPAKYVIHVASPIYEDGKKGEEHLLYITYLNALNLAKEKRLDSIAFPLLASGLMGFPRGDALSIALKAIKDFLLENEMMIYLLVYDKLSYLISLERFANVKSYLDENLEIEEYYLHHGKSSRMRFANMENIYADRVPLKKIKKERSFENILKDLEEPFNLSLLKIIDAKGLTDPEVYKKANIDRKLFSKIKTNKDYHPRKNTVLSLCIALELGLDDTKDLLQKCGYALSMASKFDIIIQYFIDNENYDIYEIDGTLFSLIGKTLSNF